MTDSLADLEAELVDGLARLMREHARFLSACAVPGRVHPEWAAVGPKNRELWRARAREELVRSLASVEPLWPKVEYSHG